MAQLGTRGLFSVNKKYRQSSRILRDNYHNALEEGYLTLSFNNTLFAVKNDLAAALTANNEHYSADNRHWVQV